MNIKLNWWEARDSRTIFLCTTTKMLLLVLGPQQSHNRRLIMFFRHSFSRSTLQQRSQVSKFAIIICSVPSLYYYSITTDSCCKCDTGDYMKRQEDIPLLLKCNTNVSTTSDKSILHHHQTSILASSPTAVSIKPIKHKRWRFKWWQKNTKQQYDTSINKKQSYWWNRIGKTFFVLTRGIEITVRLCPLIVMTPTAMLVSRCFRESTWVSDISWRYTLHTLQCLGPAFVKLGQWAATRRDLFPLHMCIRLSELQDTARVHDWKYTHQSLCEAFGQDYESSGLVVSRESILGSGSVGQVHRGTLQSNEKNIDVAVKVLHPNTKQLVQRDLALMAYIAEFIDKMIPLTIVKMLSLPRAVTNFSNVIERQVDLRVEGDNLQVFRHNFDCSDSNKRPQSITFPKPEPDWISEKVLVEEYAGDDAVPIAHYLSDNSQEGLKIRKKLAGPLLRGFLQMVFTDNFVHADLHPG